MALHRCPSLPGAVLVGSKGRMHSTGHNYTIDLLPARQFADVDTSHPARLTNSHGMPEPDWLRVARGDMAWTAWSNFRSTGPYMEQACWKPQFGTR